MAWTELGTPCVTCGNEVEPGNGRRKHCSSNCQVLDSRWKGQRPEQSCCLVCDVAIDLTSNTGRLTRSDKKFCNRHKSEHVDDAIGRAERLRYNKYRLSIAAYNELAKNGCMACGSTENLHVDHDHNCCHKAYTCGECVRGILCGGCNRALGILRDDADRIRGLAKYIEEVGEAQ